MAMMTTAMTSVYVTYKTQPNVNAEDRQLVLNQKGDQQNVPEKVQTCPYTGIISSK